MSIDPPPGLWHYTCAHAARLIIADSSTLLPASSLTKRREVEGLWQAWLVWLTDLNSPHPPEALGIDPSRQVLTTCDRTAVRFRVLEPERCVWWPTWRRAHKLPGNLERADGARPAHWYVSPDPVRVELAALA